MQFYCSNFPLLPTTSQLCCYIGKQEKAKGLDYISNGRNVGSAARSSFKFSRQSWTIGENHTLFRHHSEHHLNVLHELTGKVIFQNWLCQKWDHRRGSIRAIKHFWAMNAGEKICFAVCSFSACEFGKNFGGVARRIGRGKSWTQICDRQSRTTHYFLLPFRFRKCFDIIKPMSKCFIGDNVVIFRSFLKQLYLGNNFKLLKNKVVVVEK